jgi:hypothetical protein
MPSSHLTESQSKLDKLGFSDGGVDACVVEVNNAVEKALTRRLKSLLVWYARALDGNGNGNVNGNDGVGGGGGGVGIGSGGGDGSPDGGSGGGGGDDGGGDSGGGDAATKALRLTHTVVVSVRMRALALFAEPLLTAARALLLGGDGADTNGGDDASVGIGKGSHKGDNRGGAGGGGGGGGGLQVWLSILCSQRRLRRFWSDVDDTNTHTHTHAHALAHSSGVVDVIFGDALTATLTPELAVVYAKVNGHGE